MLCSLLAYGEPLQAVPPDVGPAPSEGRARRGSGGGLAQGEADADEAFEEAPGSPVHGGHFLT